MNSIGGLRPYSINSLLIDANVFEGQAEMMEYLVESANAARTRRLGLARTSLPY